MKKNATSHPKRLIGATFLLLYAATANAQILNTDTLSTKEKDLKHKWLPNESLFQS